MSRDVRQDLRDLAALLCTASSLARVQQKEGLGECLARESLALFRELEDRTGTAEALLALGKVHLARMEYRQARPFVEESLVLFRQFAHRRGLAGALSGMASILSYEQQHKQALALAEESLGFWREIEDVREIGDQLYQLAELALRVNEYEYARLHAEESLRLAQELEYRKAYGMALYILARVAYRQQDISVSQARYEESLAVQRELGYLEGVALILCDLAHQAWLQRKLEVAQDFCEEGTRLFLERMHRPGLINSLGQLSYIALAKGRPYWGVRLLAASDTMRQTLGLAPTPLKGAYSRIGSRSLKPLSWQTFTDIWREGQAMSPQEVLLRRDEALFSLSDQSSKERHSVQRRTMSVLTMREQEVLYWLTRGLTNRQIAQQLVVSPVTINAHVRSIYTKLEVSSRSAATRAALEMNMLQPILGKDADGGRAENS